MNIQKEDDFGGALLNCAVRYALGRRSYMPGLVMDEIRPMLKDCSEKTLWCFERDISEWLHDGEHGYSDYGLEWSRFLEDVRRARAGLDPAEGPGNNPLPEKVAKLARAYITLGANDGHDVADLVDGLKVVFDEDELKDFGVEDLAREISEANS